MPFVSRKVAADELGFSRQRLEKLIKQGRVVETDEGVDLEQARRLREVMLDARQKLAAPDASLPSSQAPAEQSQTAPAKGRERKVYAVKRGSDKVKDAETAEPIDFASARTRRENSNAKLAELRYQIGRAHV